MSSARASGRLTYVVRTPSGAAASTHDVAVLLSCDLHFAYASENGLARGAAPTSLDAWARLRGVKRVALTRDGRVRVSARGPTLVLRRAGADAAAWEFRARGAAEARAWARALDARVRPWVELLPIGGGGGGAPWGVVKADTIDRLRALPEVEVVDGEYDPAGAGALAQVLTDFDFGALADAVSAFEDVLAWAPIVGAAVMVVGMGVSLLARAATVRLNTARISRAREDVEEVATCVLDELLRCVQAGGGDVRRFEVVASILDGLEGVLRELDKYELSHALNRYRKAKTPETFLETLAELKVAADDLSARVDVDVVSAKVDAVLRGNATVLAGMDEMMAKIDRIAAVTEDHSSNLLSDPALVAALTDGIAEALLPSLFEEFVNALRVNHSAAGAVDGMDVPAAVVPRPPEWRGRAYVPRLDNRIVLNLERGSASVEAWLKESVLNEDMKNMADVGPMNRRTMPVGVWGGPGSGKTAALLIVANDKEVQERFEDGVFFVRLSHQFTADGRDIILRWGKIIESAVGEAEADRIRGAGGLDECMEEMVRWFEGRHALIVVDNVWGVLQPGSQDRREEWLWRFAEIAGQKSCVMFSTRDNSVILRTDCRYVELQVLPELSDRARLIFDSWLGVDRDDTRYDVRGVLTILSKCGGLPLSIAIAAASVRSAFYDWEFVLGSFNDGSFGDELRPGVPFSREDETLNSTISVSLQVLQKSKAEYVERFRRLSIFRRRSRIPLPVLTMLWNCSRREAQKTCATLAELALASVSTKRSTALYRLEIHDSIVMYLRHLVSGFQPEDERAGANDLVRYHQEFLVSCARRVGLLPSRDGPTPGHSSGSGNSLEQFANTAANGVSMQLSSQLVDDGSRLLHHCPWWEVDDSFLLDILVRHLVYAKWRHLAEQLLCDVRWLRQRILRRGVAKGARDDYAALQGPTNVMSPTRDSGPTAERDPALFGSDGSGGPSDSSAWFTDGVMSPTLSSDAVFEKMMRAKSFALIRRALVSSSQPLLVDVTQLGFQLVGRLLALSKESSGGRFRRRSPAAELVASATELESSRPGYFLPLWQTFAPPSDPLQAVIDTQQSGLGPLSANAVAPSPRGELIAVALRNGVAIFDWDSTRIVECWTLEVSKVANDVAWVDDSRLAVACSDSSIYVFRVEVPDVAGPTEMSRSLRSGRLTRQPVSTHTEHCGPVTCLAIDRPEPGLGGEDEFGSTRTLMASGSQDRDAYVVDVDSGEQVAELQGHTGSITDCAFIRPTRDVRLLTSSEDKTIRLFNIETGQTQFTFRGHTAAVRALAVLPGRLSQRFLSASDDKGIVLWSWRVFEGGSKVKMYRAHNHAITGLSILPDGNTFVSSSGAVGRFRVWNLDSGENWRIDRAHEAPVTALSCTFRPEGSRVLSASQDGNVRVWEVTGRRGPKSLCLHSSSNTVDAIGIVPTPSGGYGIVTCSEAGKVCVFAGSNGVKNDSAEFNPVARRGGERASSFVSSRAVKRGQVAPEGGSRSCTGLRSRQGYFVTGSLDGLCQLWRFDCAKDVEDGGGKLVRAGVPYRHTGAVMAVADAGDGWVASGSADGSVCVWNSERDPNTGGDEGLVSLAFDGDVGKSRGACFAVTASSDGSLVASGFENGSVFLHRPKQAVALCPALVDRCPSVPLGQSGHDRYAVRDLCVVESRRHRTGKLKLAGIYADCKVRVWSAQDDDLSRGFTFTVIRGHTECIYASIVFIPRSNYVVSGASDNTLRLWDVGWPDDDDDDGAASADGDDGGFEGRTLASHSAVRRRRSSPRPERYFYKNPISANARLGESVMLADLVADVRSLHILPESASVDHTVVGVGLSSGVVTKVEISPPLKQ